VLGATTLCKSQGLNVQPRRTAPHTYDIIYGIRAFKLDGLARTATGHWRSLGMYV